MKSIFVALALLLAGCSAPVAEVDQGDPGPSEDAAAPGLPDSFTKTHGTDPGNIQVAVGGIVLSHEFDLATNATLHYFVAWDLPEPSVELRVMKDGQVVDGQTLTTQEPGRLDRTVDLEPGTYTASARMTGAGSLKMFSMGGHFE